ncbi:uncharacterized protein LOC117610283 [Osmia lignaria lignaria]|uniref:uncharacterized protein LOC117610283 n=1 Tax=Osmia lignaria lignaria TaxID=1437193 RepID=UPI0014796B53|nr:uncharacterized protein LOC117610283 [Osmia lignaria]
MTFKSLMNFGNFAKGPYHPGIDRYHNSNGYHHSGSGGYYHGSRGSYKGKGGSGAALSALTLLAFLFLINVMQQSMQDNNTMATTTTSTIVLRNDDQSVVADVKEEKDIKKDEVKHDGIYGTSIKSKIQRLNSQYIN